MRTTLKRGIGQTAGLNGNGHSALPPLFGPITRYRQSGPPRRSSGRLALHAFGWFVLLVAVLGAALVGWRHMHGHESLSTIALFFARHAKASAFGLAVAAVVGASLVAWTRVTAQALGLLAVVVLASGAVGGLYLYAHETLGSVAARGSVKVAEHKLKTPVASEPAIALVAGYDHRAGEGKTYAGSNSDTLMLLRADPTNHTLSLLSFPRDLYVPIYCHSNTVYTTSRINSAWSLCGNNGPAATVSTMEHLTGLKINYLITLDFHAFKQIVNHLHGVYMNVDRRYYIAPHTGTSAINLQPGYQKLDGGAALSYVRFRHLDSDIYRTGRQQLFLEALKSRLRTSLSITDVPPLVHDLKQNLEVARGGGGSVTFSELESYLGIAYHLPAGHLFRNQIPISDFHFFTTPGGADVESAPASAIAAAVHNFLHPDVRQSQAINDQFFGHRKKTAKKKQHKLPRSKISVLVLNAGTIPGEASNTSFLLTQRGYSTRTLPADRSANAPSVQRDTTVYYDPVQPDAKQAAEQLEPLFGSHAKVRQMTTVIAEYSKLAGNPMTVVGVGTSFSGRLTVPHRVKVPAKQPPQVSDGASVTSLALRSVRRKAHFPLMVPHRIAQYSTLSQVEGVRAFKPLKHQHTVSLQFVMPNGIEYWQVQETTWNSAPILAAPTGRFFYHHQKFLIYTTGGSIQMVVLMTPRASYWVVNTILNQLSNSTMIAIAKSLQPLAR